MTIRTQSADGVTHEFADGTTPEVVDRVMKEYATKAPPEPAKPAPPEAYEGWDVPSRDPTLATPQQIQKDKALQEKSDATLKALEPSEPGLAHLLMEPVLGMVKAGQSALGERPLPKGVEALGEASMAAVPPQFARAVGSTASALGGVLPKIPSVADRPVPTGPSGASIFTERPALVGAIPYQEAAGIAKRIGPAVRAEKAITSRLNEAGPQTAQGMLDKFNEARAAGDPLTLMDVSQSAKRLGGRMYRTSGESSETIGSALRDRNAGAVGRLTGKIDQALGSEGAYDVTQTLMASRKAAAKPAYDSAYAYPPINPDEMGPNAAIGSMVSRPSVRAGMANATKIAAEEGVDMQTLGIDLDAQGEPVFVKVPTWQTLDYIKRGIDAVVEQNKDSATGRLNTYGRAANETRKDFVGVLRKLNPEYGKALDSWGGPSASIQAVDVGKNALKFSPEENAADVAELSSSDKEFARLGVAQALRDAARDKGPLASEFKTVAGTEYGSTGNRERIAPFFNNESEMNTFVKSVDREITKARTKHDVMGGSQTAERGMVDQEPLVSARDIATAGLAAAVGHGHGVLNFFKNLGVQAWDRRDPQLNAEMARILSDMAIILGRSPEGKITLHVPGPPPP